MRKKGKYPPQMGGCWFCWCKDDTLVFDCEFDTAVHKECIKEALKEDEKNLDGELAQSEAQFMKYLLEE